MPPHRVGPPRLARTDADLLPYFEAYKRGARQPGLVWGASHWTPVERLFAHGKPPARVEVVAAFYRAKLKDGTPDLEKFAAKIDKWDSECGTANGAGPVAKTAEDWLREGRCPKHPGQRLVDGACEICDGIAAFSASARPAQGEA